MKYWYINTAYRGKPDVNIGDLLVDRKENLVISKSDDILITENTNFKIYNICARHYGIFIF